MSRYPLPARDHLSLRSQPSNPRWQNTWVADGQAHIHRASSLTPGGLLHLPEPPHHHRRTQITRSAWDRTSGKGSLTAVGRAILANTDPSVVRANLLASNGDSRCCCRFLLKGTFGSEHGKAGHRECQPRWQTDDAAIISL